MGSTTQSTPAPITINIIASSGVQPDASVEDMRMRISAGRFFWLDICGAKVSLAGNFLDQLGLDNADAAQLSDLTNLAHYDVSQAPKVSSRQLRATERIRSLGSINTSQTFNMPCISFGVFAKPHDNPLPQNPIAISKKVTLCAELINPA